VVVLAQEEARSLRHNYIGTEHLLLGLLREEEGVAARVLAKLEVGVDDVRADVARVVGPGDEVPTGQIPFTPRAKKVLELALREAISLGHNYIGTEHILLGLVRENEGVAAGILLARGVDAERIRLEVIELLGLHPEFANVEIAQSRRRFRRPPRPGHGTTMMRPAWEYRIEQREELDGQWLNELGAEGWELVDISSGSFVFKRSQLPGDLRAAG